MRRLLTTLLWLLPACGLAAAGDPRLHGTWSASSPLPFTLTLAADGSGSISDGQGVPAEPLRWRAAGGQLVLEQDGEDLAYDLQLTGDTLRLSGGDFDEPLTLRRQGAAARSGGVSNVGTRPSPPAPTRRAPGAQAAGSCAGACRHIVQCAGGTASDGARCLADCQATGYQPAFLAYVEQSDCPTTLAIVQALSGGGQQGAAGVPNRSAECDGCVWDGDTCAWYSQGNWGQGPYSGAVSECSPSCCGR